MPRTLSHIIIILAWIFGVLAIIFSLTGGLDEIFFRPDDVQSLGLPLLACSAALWILAGKPTWSIIQFEKSKWALAIALTGLTLFIVFDVLVQIFDRMYFEYSRYTQSISSPAGGNITGPSAPIPGTASSNRFSFLESYREAASRSSLPDWWSWGRFIAWAIAALVLSSAILKPSQDFGVENLSDGPTKEDELK